MPLQVSHDRLGRGLRECHGLTHDRSLIAIDQLDVAFGDMVGGQQPGLGVSYGVDFLQRSSAAIAGAGVRIGMSAEGERDHLQHRRARASACARYGGSDRRADFAGIDAIYLLARDAEWRAPVAECPAARDLIARALIAAIVVDDDHKRKRQPLCQVERFVDLPLVHRTRTESADGDPSIFAIAIGERHAGCQRNRGADNPMPTVEAARRRHEVERSRLAGAEATTAAQQFRHHRAGVAALREGMAVATVRGDDLIALRQRESATRHDGFPPDGKMTQAFNLAHREQLASPFVEATDEQHLPEGLQRTFARGPEGIACL